MTEVNIGYRKNDFLWYSKDACHNNGEDCSGNDYSNNKQKSIELIEMQRVHNAANERYNNFNKEYNRKYLDSVNLVLGILIGIGVILYYYDSKMLYLLFIGICMVLIMANASSFNMPVILLIIIIGSLYRYYQLQQ